jgi:hypothetical protein
LVEKLEAAKEDRKRDAEEARRDAMIKQILLNQMNAPRPSGNVTKLQAAYEMYEVLEKTRGGPPPIVKNLINQASQRQ